MVRPTGLEPVTYGLEVPRTTFKTNYIPRQPSITRLNLRILG